MTTTEESRSSINLGSLQEALDAGGSGSLEQYLTPPDLAAELVSKLPVRNPATVFDPQVGNGALVNCITGWGTVKFGIELDQDKHPSGVQLVTANSVKVFEAIEDLMPDLKFCVANANVPFGRRWKLKDGSLADSAIVTWNFLTRHAACGFFIASANTLEKFGLNNFTGPNLQWERDNLTMTYERRPAGRYWENMREETTIGIICWKRNQTMTFTPPSALMVFWKDLQKIMDEEKQRRPAYNIYLDRNGFLKTYLSIRDQCQIDNLKKIP